MCSKGMHLFWPAVYCHLHSGKNFSYEFDLPTLMAENNKESVSAIDFFKNGASVSQSLARRH